MQLKIEHLSKHYRDIRALDDFSYTFKPGIYGILGKNGSGKSTLFKLLTDNIERDPDGKILFRNEEIDGDILDLGAKYRKVVGYMPQEQGFYEDMTARSFLLYLADLKGMPLVGKGRRETFQDVEHLLKVVHLDEWADKKIGSFSGGMRQRILLAQALLGNPGILFLDEPTVGLDPAERASFCQYLMEIAENKIILYSTHVVSDVEHVADEILMIREGRLLAHGTAQELINQAKQQEETVSTLEEAFLLGLKSEDIFDEENRKKNENVWLKHG